MVYMLQVLTVNRFRSKTQVSQRHQQRNRILASENMSIIVTMIRAQYHKVTYSCCNITRSGADPTIKF